MAEPKLEKLQATRLRVLAAGLAVLFAAVMLDKAVIASVKSLQSRSGKVLPRDRLSEMVAAFPAIAESAERPTTLVIGSSLVVHGFSGRVFEAELREKGISTDAYNLGMNGINPEVQVVLARRLRAAFEKRHAKARLSVVEFTPFQATTARRKDPDFAHLGVTNLAKIADGRSVLAEARQSPSDAAELVTLMTWGSESPEVVGDAYFERVFAPLLPAPTLKPFQKKIRERREPEFLSVRGDSTILDDLGVDDYSAWLKNRRSETRQDLKTRIDCCDILGLHFDPRAVDAQIAFVKEVQAMSEQVVLLVAPRNAAWVKPGPDAIARLKEATQRITTATNVPLLDLYDAPEFGPDDFVDSTHCDALSGAPKLSRAIASGVAPFLEGKAQ